MKQTLVKEKEQNILGLDHIPKMAVMPIYIDQIVTYPSTFSPLKPLDWLKRCFTWSLFCASERKFIQMPLVTWPKWQSCLYMVNSFKIFFYRTLRPLTVKLYTVKPALKVSQRKDKKCNSLIQVQMHCFLFDGAQKKAVA